MHTTNGTTAPSAGNKPATLEEAYEMRHRAEEAFARALRRMESTLLDDFFTTEWLQSFHREIFRDIYPHAGEFRNESIRVAWHIPSAYTREAVEEEMSQYMVDSKRRLALALLKPEAIPAMLGFAFWKLTYIAPFTDGNGRVANGLIMLLQRRFDLPGLSLYNRFQTAEYSRFIGTLREYDTGSAANFFEYLREKLGITA